MVVATVEVSIGAGWSVLVSIVDPSIEDSSEDVEIEGVVIVVDVVLRFADDVVDAVEVSEIPLPGGVLECREVSSTAITNTPTTAMPATPAATTAQGRSNQCAVAGSSGGCSLRSGTGIDIRRPRPSERAAASWGGARTDQKAMKRISSRLYSCPGWFSAK